MPEEDHPRRFERSPLGKSQRGHLDKSVKGCSPLTPGNSLMMPSKVDMLDRLWSDMERLAVQSGLD